MEIIHFDTAEEAIEELSKLPDVYCKIEKFWVWISGETKPHKDYFKSRGLRWSNNRMQWYWTPAKFRYKSQKGILKNTVAFKVKENILRAIESMELAGNKISLNSLVGHTGHCVATIKRHLRGLVKGLNDVPRFQRYESDLNLTLQQVKDYFDSDEYNLKV